MTGTSGQSGADRRDATTTTRPGGHDDRTHRRDRTRYDHREEYPHDADLTRPPALRLLVPVSPRQTGPR